MTTYHRPEGRGWNSRCSYFTISIDDEWDWDEVDSALEDVCEEWHLSIDDDSDDGDFDLNADWDRLE